MVALAACTSNGDGDGIRFTVKPSSIELSGDRRTITVGHGNAIDPPEGCAAQPDGVDVVLDDAADVARLTVWMRTVELPDNADCILRCDYMTQSVTLDQPLSDAIEVVSSDDAGETCWPSPEQLGAAPPVAPTSDE